MTNTYIKNIYKIVNIFTEIYKNMISIFTKLYNKTVVRINYKLYK